MQVLSLAGENSDAVEIPAVPLDQQALVEAFGTFSAAARSLQQSYFSLGEEVRRLRRQLQQERDLRMRREALAEMSALIAHEVRNPLGSLELFAGILAESELAARDRDCVEQIQAGLRLVSATVNNVLEFHSPSPIERSEVEIGSLVKSIRSLVAPIADRGAMKITVRESNDPVWVHADRHRLEQVFLNLCLNAFRFAAAGGRLEIRVEREGARAVITFADQGPGIEAGARAQIFDAGFTTRAGGPGLGLAVAKRIMEQHGGSIGVADSPGGGATIALRLPLPLAEARS